jgi:hypothetical protein
MADLSKTAARLCQISKSQYRNPYAGVQAWPELLDWDQWFTSPELISIYGMPEYEQLSTAEKKRLSFHEAVNFFSLNIHGEKSLVEGLARRLYGREHRGLSAYLHHFLDEENKHMIYFGEFCMRYAGKIYAEKKWALARDYEAGEESFLFFAKALIFEEIVDAYNSRMARDETLAPIARQIHALHHADEARHLAFGRQLVTALFHAGAPGWSRQTLEGISDYLKAYLAATWREYSNPEVYRDAGLKDPWGLQARALESPHWRARRKSVGNGCVRYLFDQGILKGEPWL